MSNIKTVICKKCGDFIVIETVENIKLCTCGSMMVTKRDDTTGILECINENDCIKIEECGDR